MEDGKVVRKILEAAQDGTTPLPVAVSSSALPTDASTHTGQDELKALIGEVQASPTSNTVLDRLKSAVTHLATIAGFISGGHGQVDVLSSALPTGAATAANQRPAATTITMDSITLTAANTEYSKAIVTGCKKLTFRCVDSTKIAAGSDIRYAFETDKVHDVTLPFMLLDGGSVYSESGLDLTGKTLYIAGVTAGDIVLLEMWT